MNGIEGFMRSTECLTAQHELDTSGLRCPEPVMLLHKQVRDMAVGEVLKVVATDPSTQRDIPKFCQFLGHSLINQSKEEDEGSPFLYWIQKEG